MVLCMGGDTTVWHLEVAKELHIDGKAFPFIYVLIWLYINDNLKQSTFPQKVYSLKGRNLYIL